MYITAKKRVKKTNNRTIVVLILNTMYNLKRKARFCVKTKPEPLVVNLQEGEELTY